MKEGILLTAWVRSGEKEPLFPSSFLNHQWQTIVVTVWTLASITALPTRAARSHFLQYLVLTRPWHEKGFAVLTGGVGLCIGCLYPSAGLADLGCTWVWDMALEMLSPSRWKWGADGSKHQLLVSSCTVTASLISSLFTPNSCSNGWSWVWPSTAPRILLQ